MSNPSEREHGTSKRTRFGEALWVDTLKTIGVALATLMVMFLIGGFLALMVVAPWGRASPECSMFCVLEKQLVEMFDGDPQR